MGDELDDANRLSESSSDEIGLDNTTDSSGGDTTQINQPSLLEHLQKTVNAAKAAKPEGEVDPEDDEDTDSSEEKSKKKSDVQALNDTETEDKKKESEDPDAEDVEKEGEETDEEKKEKSEDEEEESKDEEAKKKDGEEEEEEKEDESEKKQDRSAEGRIKELVEEKKYFSQELQIVKPKAESYDRIDQFCKSNGIDGAQFEKAMHVQALLNTDPEAALKELLPIVEQLQGFVGNKLPSDLQEKVDAGRLEADDAKEIARLRAKSQFGSKKTEFDQRRVQQQQQQLVENQMRDAFIAWDTTMQGKDPDYKPNASEPGKYEMVSDRFMSLMNQRDNTGKFVNNLADPNIIPQLMQKAYDQISKQFTKTIPKPPPRKHLLSNGSSHKSVGKKTIEGAKTLQEAIQIGLERGV